jgi:HK97 family phage prohead protease
VSDRIERSSWPVRAVHPGIGVELTRSVAGEGVTMSGHFAVFDQWTEINSVFEGRFMERIARGAFRKTFRERGNKIKVLFQHGRDPLVGDKVLGSITKLAEDSRGAAYEVDLLDTEYVRELILALDRGLYGASFRFRPMKVEMDEDAKPSSHNPNGLPECTVTECSVSEFGPVTFPAYGGATAGVRSLTDELAFNHLAHTHRLDELAAFSDRILARPDASTTASSPRASSFHPAGLWGLEDSPAEPLPDWWVGRNAELRQQTNRHGTIE